MSEPEKINNAADQFRTAIENCKKGRRVVIAWAYLDEDGDSWENFGNYSISEVDWEDIQLTDTILRIIAQISQIHVNAES